MPSSHLSEPQKSQFRNLRIPKLPKGPRPAVCSSPRIPPATGKTSPVSTKTPDPTVEPMPMHRRSNNPSLV